jgi:hypothetical protein
MYKFTVSKTFSVVTPESAEHGDYDHHGYIFEDQLYTLKEVLNLLLNEGYYLTYSIPGLIFEQLDPDIDYSNGNETYKYIHVRGKEQNLKRLKEAYIRLEERHKRGEHYRIITYY